jgi:RimJ/RimL family protein N-acetyltransferase
MNNSIKIRKLKEPDFVAFSQLRLEALQNFPTGFCSSYEEEKASGMLFFKTVLEQNKKENCIFGAFINNKLIGIVGIYQETQLKLKHICNIWGMYVQPTYQKRGIGKALLEVALKHAKDDLNCLLINLSVNSNNKIAIKLYESCGFKVWGTELKAIQIDEKFYDILHLSY